MSGTRHYDPDTWQGTRSFIAASLVAGLMFAVIAASSSATTFAVAGFVGFTAALYAVVTLGFAIYEIGRAARRRAKSGNLSGVASRTLVAALFVALVGFVIYQQHEIRALRSTTDSLTTDQQLLQQQADSTSSDVSDLQNQMQSLQDDIDRLELRY